METDICLSSSKSSHIGHTLNDFSFLVSPASNSVQIFHFTYFCALNSVLNKRTYLDNPDYIMMNLEKDLKLSNLIMITTLYTTARH